MISALSSAAGSRRWVPRFWWRGGARAQTAAAAAKGRRGGDAGAEGEGKEAAGPRSLTAAEVAVWLDTHTHTYCPYAHLKAAKDEIRQQVTENSNNTNSNNKNSNNTNSNNTNSNNVSTWMLSRLWMNVWVTK